MVKHHKQQQTLYVVGGICIAAGVFYSFVGGNFLQEKKPSNNPLSQIAIDFQADYRRYAVLSLGASIPFLYFAWDQSKKRDKAIEESKRLLE